MRHCLVHWERRLNWLKCRQSQEIQCSGVLHWDTCFMVAFCRLPASPSAPCSGLPVGLSSSSPCKHFLTFSCCFFTPFYRERSNREKHCRKWFALCTSAKALTQYTNARSQHHMASREFLISCCHLLTLSSHNCISVLSGTSDHAVADCCPQDNDTPLCNAKHCQHGKSNFVTQVGNKFGQ